MTNEERIRRLELAVLHLSRAINDLIAAQQSETIDDIGSVSVPELAGRSRDDAVRAAFESVQTAVNSLSNGQ